MQMFCALFRMDTRTDADIRIDATHFKYLHVYNRRFLDDREMCVESKEIIGRRERITNCVLVHRSFNNTV